MKLKKMFYCLVYDDVGVAVCCKMSSLYVIWLDKTGCMLQEVAEFVAEFVCNLGGKRFKKIAEL